MWYIIFTIFFFLTVNEYFASIFPPFDPSDVDWCSTTLSCKDNQAAYHDSTACSCSPAGNRSEETHDVVEFRTESLRLHNVLRNRLAGGLVGNYSPATNMRAMSYSMELEYVARCFVINYFVDGHDKCRNSPHFRTVGQNLGLFTDPYTWPYLGILSWFEDWKLYKPELIKKIPKPQGVNESHHENRFIQFAYAKDYAIGCARGYKIDGKVRSERYVVVCNYGGSNSSSKPETSVYEEGDVPCSQCPEDLKCSEEYPNLCGEIESVPTDPILLKKSSCLTHTVLIYLLITGLIFVLMYSFFLF